MATTIDQFKAQVADNRDELAKTGSIAPSVSSVPPQAPSGPGLGAPTNPNPGQYAPVPKAERESAVMPPAKSISDSSGIAQGSQNVKDGQTINTDTGQIYKAGDKSAVKDGQTIDTKTGLITGGTPSVTTNKTTIDQLNEQYKAAGIDANISPDTDAQTIKQYQDALSQQKGYENLSATYKQLQSAYNAKIEMGQAYKEGQTAIDRQNYDNKVAIEQAHKQTIYKVNQINQNFQTSSGTSSSRSLSAQNAVNKVGQQLTDAYDAMVARGDVSSQRAYEDLANTATKMSNQFNATYSGRMQNMLTALQGMDTTGNLNTADGIIKGKDAVAKFIDTLNDDAIAHASQFSAAVEGYKAKLTYNQQTRELAQQKSQLTIQNAQYQAVNTQNALNSLLTVSEKGGTIGLEALKRAGITGPAAAEYALTLNDIADSARNTVEKDMAYKDAQSKYLASEEALKSQETKYLYGGGDGSGVQGGNVSNNASIPTTGFTLNVPIVRTGTNIAVDTNNPGNITADSVPNPYTKEGYGQKIGATGTYISPNGREYYVFPTVDAGKQALINDITAKVSGQSAVISKNDTLAQFVRTYTGSENPVYLDTLMKQTGANSDTKIGVIDPASLSIGVMKAEGFSNASPSADIVKGFDDAKKPMYIKYNTGKFTNSDWKALMGMGVGKNEFINEAANFAAKGIEKGTDMAKELINEATKLKTAGWSRTGAAWGLGIIPYTGPYDFQQSFDQFKNSLTFNSLMDLKANGVSFGKLTNMELQAVANSASSLKEGMSNEDYQNELDRIIQKFKPLLAIEDQRKLESSGDLGNLNTVKSKTGGGYKAPVEGTINIDSNKL